MSDHHDNQQAPDVPPPNMKPVPPLVATQHNLASREQRFSAAMIDGILGTVVMLPLFSYYGIWELIMTETPIPNDVSYIIIAYSLFMFFALHGLLLFRYGQTIGKRMMGLAIVMLDGQRPSFTHLILNRYLPQWIAGSIHPFLGLVDIMFIFRGDRRCLHDLIAGTKVVDLGSGVNPGQSRLIA